MDPAPLKQVTGSFDKVSSEHQRPRNSPFVSLLEEKMRIHDPVRACYAVETLR